MSEGRLTRMILFDVLCMRRTAFSRLSNRHSTTSHWSKSGVFASGLQTHPELRSEIPPKESSGPLAS